MMEQNDARQLKQEISRILWEVWDPIGVNSFPEARDEYVGYVNDVYTMLIQGSSDAHIASHLLAIVTERMGLSGCKIDGMMPTVEALREISIPSNL
jgi:hypothetical protein